MTHHHTVPLAVAVLISLSALQGHAAPAGPFAGMAGSWSVTGSLTMANGAQERLRCRANYRVGGNGSVSGRVNGGTIQVVARGDAFSARLSLVTRGNRQSVAILPQGTEISEVSVALAKGQPATTGAAR